MLLTLLPILSISTALSPPSCIGPICQQYELALNIAKSPSPARIYRSLTPLRPSNPSLKFDSSGRVLLAALVPASSYPYSPGQSFSLIDQAWFTAAPDLQNACKFYSSPDKLLRMKQQLGLPPNDPSTIVIEVFANLKDIFRPCPDPEITDSECTLEISVENKETADDRVPWFCPKEGEEILQTSGRWLSVARKHFDWMCERWRISYLNSETYQNYPWTGLGYTYDWATELGYGLSEFVVIEGAEVMLKSKSSVDDYCVL